MVCRYLTRLLGQTRLGEDLRIRHEQAATSTEARIVTPAGGGIDPMQIMMSGKDCLRSITGIFPWYSSERLNVDVVMTALQRFLYLPRNPPHACRQAGFFYRPVPLNRSPASCGHFSPTLHQRRWRGRRVLFGIIEERASTAMSDKHDESYSVIRNLKQRWDDEDAARDELEQQKSNYLRKNKRARSSHRSRIIS